MTSHTASRANPDDALVEAVETVTIPKDLWRETVDALRIITDWERGEFARLLPAHRSILFAAVRRIVEYEAKS